MSDISFFITGRRSQMAAVLQRGEAKLVGNFIILPDSFSNH